MNRRRFLRYAAGVAATGMAGVLVDTFWIEPHWVEVVHRSLPVVGLPPTLVGSRLIQISDLHVGPQVEDQYLAGCLQTVSDLKPDFLVITGDLVTYQGPRQLSQLRHLLRGLPKPRLASLAVLGNHDWYYHLPGAAMQAIRQKIVAALGLANPDAFFPHDLEEAGAQAVKAALLAHSLCARLLLNQGPPRLSRDPASPPAAPGRVARRGGNGALPGRPRAA